MKYQELKSRVGSDPHKLAFEIQMESVPPQERVAALFEAFEDLCSYGILMYIKHAVDAAETPLRLEILERYRKYLEDGDEKIAEQVLYSLWCDFFEDSSTVEVAWRHLVGLGSAPAPLERVLPNAGPVPWKLKKPLLESLALSGRWHDCIFRCLLHSTFDVYGSIDRVEARRLLARLQLSPDVEHLDRLVSQLQA